MQASATPVLQIWPRNHRKPAVSLDRVTRLQNWAIDNDILTSFTKAKATPDIIELDGTKALHYQADGLYQQDIYLVSYKNRAYMFVGQYDAPSDITKTAFDELIGTVTFE